MKGIKENIMETKHTPGPWQPKYTGSTPVNIEAMVGKIHRVIAEAHDYASIGIKETEANAKLIAAAPELLEALTDCLFHMRMNDLNSKHPEDYQKGIDAIAKATS